MALIVKAIMQDLKQKKDWNDRIIGRMGTTQLYVRLSVLEWESIKQLSGMNFESFIKVRLGVGEIRLDSFLPSILDSWCIGASRKTLLRSTKSPEEPVVTEDFRNVECTTVGSTKKQSNSI